MKKKLYSKIVDRYLTTTPVQVREMFNLVVGDSWEWEIDDTTGSITLTPMRLGALTPKMIDFLESAESPSAGRSNLISDVDVLKQQVEHKKASEE